MSNKRRGTYQKNNGISKTERVLNYIRSQQPPRDRSAGARERYEAKPQNHVIAVRARRNYMLSLHGGGQFCSTRGASYDKFPRNTLQRHNPKAVVESEVF